MKPGPRNIVSLGGGRTEHDLEPQSTGLANIDELRRLTGEQLVLKYNSCAQIQLFCAYRFVYMI